MKHHNGRLFLRLALVPILSMLFMGVVSISAPDTVAGGGQSLSKKSPAPGALTVEPNYGKMPLYFIPNRGQMDERVDYYLQGKDKAVYFTSEGLTFVLNEKSAKSESTVGPRRSAVKLDFVGATADVRPSGEEKTGAIVSYFKGKPEEWKAGLPTYSRIVYKNLWPGIDLAYYGTVDKMKYEFIVAPGADPSLVRLAYRGADDVALNSEGRLVVKTPAGGFEDDRPVGYQETNGKRLEVGLRYALEVQATDEPGFNPGKDAVKSYVYGFEVGEYDRTKPLVLDPAVLVYCGYIGGSGYDHGYGIAVDGSGCAYVTGQTAPRGLSGRSSVPT